MRHRLLTLGAAGLLAIAPAMGQGAKTSWTPARTPDGQPDFQGIWDTSTLTPLERSAEFAGKERLTAQEAAEYERQTLSRINTDRRDGPATTDLNRNYNEFWRDRGTRLADGRTALIVDPPDGRIPLTPEARRKRAAFIAAEAAPTGPEDLPLRLRCITRGLPMTPTPNNNYFQIVQGQGFVVILQEMMYEARVIPLDGRPHAPQGVRAYMGDARGRWEGDTLAIDTTNFFGKFDLLGSDAGLHLTERLTRTDADTIRYEFTADDPTAFTKPWSAAIPMRKTDEQLFKYECHEGNYTMEGVLAGARAEEAAKRGSK